jgi:hypothetical protein
MPIVIALLTLATIALGYYIYLEFGAWGRRQARAAARDKARYPVKKPPAVRLYCPACGTQAVMQGASSFSRHDFIRQPWCPGCKVWIKSPVRVNQIEGGTT